LASVVNAEEPAVLWGFIEGYAPGASTRDVRLEELVKLALAYYRDFVKPNKAYRLPTDAERQGLEEMAGWLEAYEAGSASGDEIAATIQNEVYEIGKRCGFAEDLRAWFKSLYEVLLGQQAGPRFGSFVAYYGASETAALIRQVLSGQQLDHPAA
ncbi:MAG: lysine--tRNA ligase, partial [Pseudomonadota bacterium]